MGKYKEKVCLLCGEIYTPTGPKQKYCTNCKVEGKKLQAKICGKERDRIRNKYAHQGDCSTGYLAHVPC